MTDELCPDCHPDDALDAVTFVWIAGERMKLLDGENIGGGFQVYRPEENRTVYIRPIPVVVVEAR